MKKFELKLEKDCSNNICPMPLNIVVNTIKGMELIKYDEKTLAAELAYDETMLSEEGVVRKLEERKYKVVK